ncbi:uncharacterized protein LOC108835119 [Raphanus sativus]|uniref:Uncharacterized protein LOC108835119 n=1 Tax=Raphanus sativus TaxID=3726 RepID=A0A9W3CHL0_RAPSA|nr:uncharacterized protein LOC108835119 [Raphanus sativus]
MVIVLIMHPIEPPNLSYVSLRVLAPLPLDDGEGSHTQLVDTLSGIARKPNGEETSTVTENEDGDSFDLGSFCLEPCNVKRVVPERVLVVKFLPSDGVKLVAAGDNCRSCKGCVPAYFSPSGLSLATTSRDNYVGVLSGANFEDTSMIYHFSSTVCSISNFRGVWGWDDSHIFVGNVAKGIGGNQTRGIDVISTKLKRTVKKLQSPLLKDVMSRLYCHPLNVGMLAGSTAGGYVYVWTTK